MAIKNLAIFCGSSFGFNPCYSESAKKVAEVLAEKEINLIYGGASVGLMGIMADNLLSYGGTVIGVIPQSLVDQEIAHPRLTQLHIVKTMHERKALMSELADAFLMMPGGAGSLEEFFEVYTWAQLGLHQKPFGILNINHYYDHLLQFLNHSVEEGFLKKENRDLIFVDSHLPHLIEQFSTSLPSKVSKWLTQQKPSLA